MLKKEREEDKEDGEGEVGRESVTLGKGWENMLEER